MLRLGGSSFLSSPVPGATPQTSTPASTARPVTRESGFMMRYLRLRNPGGAPGRVGRSASIPDRIVTSRGGPHVSGRPPGVGRIPWQVSDAPLTERTAMSLHPHRLGSAAALLLAAVAFGA